MRNVALRKFKFLPNDAELRNGLRNSPSPSEFTILILASKHVLIHDNRKQKIHIVREACESHDFTINLYV